MSKPSLFLFACLFLSILQFSCDGNLQKGGSDKFANISPGESLYKQYCLSCHKSNGSGVPDLYPSLKGEKVKGDKMILIKVVLLDIEREALNKGNYKQGMPGQDFLNSQEIAFIINYIRKRFGHVDDPVTADEVANVKKEFR